MGRTVSVENVLISITDSYQHSLLAFLVLMGMLSQCNLSPITADNRQDQEQISSRVVNQPTSTALWSPPMSWIKTLKNITEISGRTFYLECQVQSAYPVAFNWYRYNNPLDKTRFLSDPSTGRSSLQIKNLKETQAGFYTCEASNGFQSVSSNGFVRVQNPDIDPIDIPDDLLPPIEFSVEKNQGLHCEIYSGSICQSIVGSNYVSVSDLKQREIEENFLEHMKLISDECRRVLLPMICLFIYPLCDQQRLHVRSVCRHSCFYFENHPCTREISISLVHSIPTCENLPPASDDPSCLPIEAHRNGKENGGGLFTAGLGKEEQMPRWTAVHSLVSSSSPPAERLFFSDSVLIVVLSIGLPIVIISLFFLSFYCCYHRLAKASPSSSFTRGKEQASHLSSPLHSIHSRTTHQAVLSSSSSSTNTRVTNLSARQTLLNSTDSNILCELSPEKIRFLQEIGEGEFGRVYLGEFTDSNERCLVKTLQTEKATEEYLREIEIFRHLHHVHISCLLGICIQSHETFSFLIYEYLNHGDLHTYITQHSETLSLRDFLQLAIQITSGMIYLSEKNVHHNDLALRNILISEYRTIKITNVARYRREFHLDYYKIANHLLPVRWMSLESLLSGISSEMSDVWSFGVLLWEMFSYGVQPYCGYTNPEVIEMIRDRTLLSCPLNCPRRVFALMCSCWEEFSEHRPTFVALMERLKQWEERALTCLFEPPTGRSATPAVLMERTHIRFHS